MNAVIELFNSTGSKFVEFALAMLVQSSVLIVILLILDSVLKRKVRAVFRYWLWLLVLVKLTLPSSLSSPVSLGNWFADELANVNIAQIAADVAPEHIQQTQEAAPVELNSKTAIATPPASVIEPLAPEIYQAPAVKLTQLSFRAVVFLLWLIVVAVMGLLLLQRVFFVMGLIAQAKDVNDLMNGALEFCHKQMAMKSKVGLKVSPNATSPAVCGLFRPVILVPENLAPSLGAGHLRAVLMHELAHIKRGDLWINLAQTILQIIYFYNPFLWLANSVIRRLREQAVDEMVLVAMGKKARQYPQTLVAVAKLAFKRPALSLRLIGVVESKSALKTRIKRILERPLPKTAKLGLAGLLAILITGVLLLPMAKAESEPPSFLIKGTVTDAETGQPIAGAKVGDVDQYAEGKQWTTTDSNGNYEYKTWYEEHGTTAEAEGYNSQLKGFNTKLFGSEKEKVINFQLTLEKNAERSEFKATLSNGVTVKLVGICKYPSGPIWSPDGTKLEKELVLQQHERLLRPNTLGFVVKLNTNDFCLRYKIDGVSSYSKVEVYDNAGRELQSSLAAIAQLEDDRTVTNVRLGIATSKWQIIAESDKREKKDIVFSSPVESKDGTAISVRGDWDFDGERRIVAIDKSGNAHIGDWRGHSSWSKTIVMSEIKNVTPDQIEKFQLQFRPYEWVTFKNVSLKPNFETNVQIEVGKSIMQIEGSNVPSGDQKPESKRQVIKGKYLEARQDPEIIKKVARELFDKIQNADYDYFLNSENMNVWEQFPIVGYYNSYKDYPTLIHLMCKTFKHNPIVKTELDNISTYDQPEEWPRVYYKLTLKDGSTIEGDLHFEYGFYYNDEGRWIGIHGHFYQGPETLYKIHGLDWHLYEKFIEEPNFKTNVQIEVEKPAVQAAGEAVLQVEDKSQVIHDKELNLSVTIPSNWQCYKNPNPGMYKFSWQLIPSELKAWAMLIGAELTDEITGPVRQIAVGDAAALKSFFDKYKVRDDSWIDTTISGLPAAQFAADYVFKGKQMVEYRTYLLGESMVYWFVFRVEKELFEANKPIFDSIINSFKLSSENTKEDNGRVPQVALDSAQKWLRIIDNGDYEKGWEQSASFFKTVVGREQFIKSIEPVRTPLGKVISREVESKQYTKTVPGAPDGEYVIIEFETSFENKKAAIETVIAMLDEDGSWRIAGYYIK